jgi:RNA polymerase sigma-70 factor (ECF subfamily)
MTSKEKHTIRRFQRGDSAGFEALYAEYGNRLYRFCYRLCGRAADAEDLTQEVFLAAYTGLDRFEGRSSVATWLYRIALYRWRAMRQSLRAETVTLDEEMSVLSLSSDPEQSGLARVFLSRALNALPEDLREALLLVKAEGLKYREAAEVLGIPQGTVQYRVSEAMARLRTQLQEPGSEHAENKLKQATIKQTEDTKRCNVNA